MTIPWSFFYNSFLKFQGKNIYAILRSFSINSFVKFQSKNIIIKLQT